MNNTKKLLPFLAVVCLAVFGLSSAYAQDGGRGFQIEEIVVTAERREETINDVPLSLTAFNTDALDQLGIYDDQDIIRSKVICIDDQKASYKMSLKIAIGKKNYATFAKQKGF